MVIATGPKGTVRNFSKRFSLSGMTGTFLPEVKAALEDVEGTDGPARIGETAAGGAPAPGDDLYDVPYAMQTGFTRYAPMQPIPPTKITKKDFKPLNPTSAFTIATTFLPLPKIHTTITQSQTYSVSSQENPVPAASHPTDDMEKFLARWKD
ncbi:hypothetical protein M011DRAFT_466625 [Sporormia fimetaria CBS 119925]|uniref:Yeast cell wall synthesis Kre9/Knh1 C-terminal domain-containing protein n=1 Tax=Sporormia fimetaria CBS 119925 TaxID=1340428 RepID=A0A6A6VE69_9PLEO|nr:hypothetical protein M011DRAFT_466625 [Sporormia fimetaria CBS 119925]